MKQMTWSAILMGIPLIPFIFIIILQPSEHFAMLGLIVTAGILGIGVVFFINSPEQIRKKGDYVK